MHKTKIIFYMKSTLYMKMKSIYNRKSEIDIKVKHVGFAQKDRM